MHYLKIGLVLLMFLRLATLGDRWRRVSGRPQTFDGETMRVKVGRDKHKNVRLIRILLEIPDRFRFSLRPETFLDRLAKRFGVAREWQTGDDGFDQRVFIVSEDQVLLEKMSVDPELRALLGTLLAFEGGGNLVCARGRLWFDCLPIEQERHGTDARVSEQYARKLFPTLARLREHLTRVPVSDWQADRDPALDRKAWLIGVSVLLGFAGLVGFVVDAAFDRHQVVHETIRHHSAWSTAAIAAALLAGTFLWLRATPHSHAVLLDILLAALPGAWFTANAGFTWYNQHYDDRTPARHAVRVEQAYTTKSRGSTNYHLIVASWPDARGDREVTVRAQEFTLLKEGGCVGVIWHPGRLGDGWVSGYESGIGMSCDGGMIE